MGCFSWITQNSNRSIIMCGYGSRKYPSRTCYMWDNKGRRWRQEQYEGYGIFGGKDYYILLAEMNIEYGSDVDDEQKRTDGIEIEFTKEKNKNYLYPNLTDCKDWVWINKKPEHCPQQGSCDWNGLYDSCSDEDENDFETRRDYTKIQKYDGWANGLIKQN